ncbi:AEC family transporter [Arthrobacter sp. Soil782]|uniref:AEC family transporter n=1 Tax=Arthrobacter sp. Soil782 TaxID=1736410 RepID=UPI0009E6DE8C|nr:AEC family transporter [Arthrobacter sp. Soil782]
MGRGVIDIDVVIALIGAVILIGLGSIFRHSFIPSPEFWSGLEKLVYFVLLPALLVTGLAGADFASIEPGPMVLVLTASATFSALLAYAARRPATGRDGPAFTSVFQGTVRFNTYIGVTTAAALFGSSGIAIAALANAVLIPFGNLASTVALAHYGHHRLRGSALILAVFGNPLILACVVGLAANLIGSAPGMGDFLSAPAPAVGVQLIAAVLGLLGGAALPIGLFCVGAGLRGRVFPRESLRPVTAALLLRFVPVPAATLGLCLLLGFTGPAAVVCVVFQSLPTATSSYVFARRLGGDASLMAQITAAQTVLSGVVLPAWILIALTVLL